MGYSINLITLFGLILAIGIVVDDAIIVVENTQRHMADGLSPKEATRKAMGEISGAIIATTLVLLAVGTIAAVALTVTTDGPENDPVESGLFWWLWVLAGRFQTI